MVNIMRVDERLLHGQVAVTWVNHLDVTSLLVINDAVSNDEMSKMAIRMVKPASVNLSIKSVEDGIKVLNDPRAEKLKILVIIKTIQDAAAVLRGTNNISKVNIGGVRKKEGAKLIAPAVYLDDKDMRSLKELSELCEDVEFRMTPSDSPKTATQILAQYSIKGGSL